MTSLEQRFWSKVEKQDHWYWLAGKDEQGYGLFQINRKNVRAHRFAYEVSKGEIPDGLQLDHLCEIKSCVNPDHLKPSTAKDNVQASYKRKDPNWSRGKSYLIYVRHPRFFEEKNKSELINGLLSQHYEVESGSPFPEPSLKEKPRPIKTTADLDLPAQKVTGDRCPHGFNLKVSKCKYGCKKGA